MPRTSIADEPLIERSVGFTRQQRRWLQLEAERLDRPVPWIVRKAIDGYVRENGGYEKKFDHGQG